MAHTEIKVGNALLDAKDIIGAMAKQGIAEPVYMYAAAKRIAREHKLSIAEAAIIIEEAIKL